MKTYERDDTLYGVLYVTKREADAEIDCAIEETRRLRHAIRQTIMENLHLADGEVCTLKRLKDAIGFDLDESLKEQCPKCGAIRTYYDGWNCPTEDCDEIKAPPVETCPVEAAPSQ